MTTNTEMARVDYDSLPAVIGGKKKKPVESPKVEPPVVESPKAEPSKIFPTDFLRKDKEAQDSLKAEWRAKGVTGTGLSEKVLDELGIDAPGYTSAMDLFSEGFDEEHVADAVGLDTAAAVKIRHRYFDPVFKAWSGARKPIEEEEEAVTGVPGRVHEKIVEYVFKPGRQRVRVTIEFQSKFDSTGEMSGQEGKDPEFKWKEYRAEIKERSGKHNLHYTFTQDLDPKTGKLVGTPREKLFANDNVVEPSHALMKMIQTNLKKYILPEDGSARGVTPMHHSFSVHYVNTYHGDREIDWQDFHSVEDFVSKHHGIFPKDEQHLKWEHDKRQHEERKILGPYQVESELTALISQYERDIKRELDPKAKATMKEKIKELKEMIKQKTDLDQKALDDLIRQEMLLRHPTHVPITQHEVTTEKPKEEEKTAQVLLASKLIYALANLPPPGGGDIKTFVNIAKKYKGRNLDKWLEPAQIVQMAEQVNSEIGRLRVLHIKDPDMVKRLEGDKESFQKYLPEFIADMKVRLGILQKKYPVDYEVLAKNRDVEWVTDAGKINKLLGDVKGKFTSAPVTAIVLPAPKSDDAQKLVSLFYSYGITHNPNPKHWLDPGDITVLAKSLHGAVVAKLEKELGADKPKGMSEEDWKTNLNGIKLSYEQDLQNAEKLFPKFIADLKDRLHEFADAHPADYNNLATKKNTYWVGDNSAVQEVLKRVVHELRMPLDMQKHDPKQPGVKIIEIGKFEALGGFLRSQLKGFLTLGSRFKRDSLNTVSSEESLAGYKADLNKLKESFDANAAELNKGRDTLTDEEKDGLADARKKLANAMKAAQEKIESREAVPAVKGAHVMLSYLNYFSSLFSIFSSMLWYRNKYSSENEKFQLVSGGVLYESEDGLKWLIDVAAEDAPKEEKKKKEKAPPTRDEMMQQAGHLQEEIYDEAHYISGLRLKPKEAVKEGLTNLRTMLLKFLDVIEKTRSRTAAEGDYEEAFKKYVIPENLLQRGEAAIRNLEHHSNPKVKAMAPIAEKEFKAITESLVAVYREGFTDEDIKALAKKKSISPEKAAVQLRKHQDALTSAAMFGFSEAWEKILKDPGAKKKVEKTPLGNLHPSEYKRMNKFVEDHLPELAKLAPSEEEPKEPSPGIPTPKKIRESIERLWTTEKIPTPSELERLWAIDRELTPEEIGQLWKNETDEMDFGGGGGGGKSKARAKAMKTPPPSGTWQQIMHNMSSKIKGIMNEDAGAAKNAMEHMVVETLMRYVLTVKKELAKIKSDEYLPPDEVVDGLVYLVKQIFNLMMNLKVAPSSQMLMIPPKGAPDFKGNPDITINSYKEAREFYDTFVGVMDVINEYLDPHKINIPKFQFVHPDKGSRRPEKYFPNGFMETIQFYQLKEHGITRPDEEKYKPLPHIPGGAEELEKEKKGPSFSGHGGIGEYQKMKEKEWQEKKKADVLFDYPTQMSANIASKFIGVELSDDEYNAVMS